MGLQIEDYALIGNCETAGLVGRNGSIDWLTLPQFDSDACFASLLGTDDNGRWLLGPRHESPQIVRRYQPGTLVLETQFTTPEGSVVVIDCMERRNRHVHLLRLVRGLGGRVPMKMELVIRFNYGSVAPWVTRLPDDRTRAVAGPDQLILSCPVPYEGRDLTTVADFTVDEGQELGFSLVWSRSWRPIPKSPEVGSAVAHVAETWRQWSSQYKRSGPYVEPVLRSLITLKAVTHHATGGVTAAATTSLPEELGGSRNWDYRYCWLRDSTFTLYSLMSSGFYEEAKAWRDWLVRAVAGSPEKMQIMYSVLGSRRLPEFEIPWLSGYENSRPVRVGNAASDQVQLDIYGEVLDLLYQSRRLKLSPPEASWSLERSLIECLEQIWNEPDEGIWEVRGGARQFTYSKVMAWVALDRAVRTMEEFQLEGPVEKWRSLRSTMHAEICHYGYNSSLGSFVQSYDSDRLDASLLLLPLVGFLPADDPRMLCTVAAIEKQLMKGGLVMRYKPDASVEGVDGSEGVFLACSFWLADNYVLQNQHRKAKALYEHLLTLRNDVGLLSEEYDPVLKRQLGNFPQAFSHVALVNTAHNLTEHQSPARQRSGKRRQDQ